MHLHVVNGFGPQPGDYKNKLPKVQHIIKVLDKCIRPLGYKPKQWLDIVQEIYVMGNMTCC